VEIAQPGESDVASLKPGAIDASAKMPNHQETTTMSRTSDNLNLDGSPPLTSFSSCHAGIVSHLKTFGELPALLGPAARARKIAEETLAFFQGAVFDHHAEEERGLFPAVLAPPPGARSTTRSWG
jgi:hypothetical protein